MTPSRDFTEHTHDGVLMDSCRLVIVDPVYLSRETQHDLVRLARRGVCVVVDAVSDGAYPVAALDAGVLIVDPTHSGELVPLERGDAADCLQDWLQAS